MKAALPVYQQAPLEYRLALDVACTWLAMCAPVCLRCDQPDLSAEAEQRLPLDTTPPWQGALWLEPQVPAWQAGLEEFSSNLASGARVAAILSLPPARRLPDRQAWQGTCLGEQRGGLKQFLKAFTGHGMIIDSVWGMHSWRAVGLNAAAHTARRLGWWALGDRLEFAARLLYTQQLGWAWSCTCALIMGHQA